MMKLLFAIFFFFFFNSTIAQSDSEIQNKHFGISLGGHWRISQVGLTASSSVLYYTNRHQYSLGIATKPFYLNSGRTILGAEFNYRIFPNRLDNTVSSYFCTYLNYLANVSKASYSFSEHSLSLTVGYGFQVKIFKGLYLSTDVGVGRVTESFSVNENPPPYTYPYKLFTNYNWDAVLNFNVGYRFLK